MTVKIYNPNANEVVSGTITVSGPSTNAVRVDLKVDNGLYQLANGTNNWSKPVDTKLYLNGNHTLTARATSSTGQTATVSRSITIANMPAELTCCIESGGGAAMEISIDEASQYLTLPLNFGQGTNHKCWKETSGDLRRKQGVWPFRREVKQYGYWCAKVNQAIVASKVVTDWSTGPACSKTGSNQFKVSGGTGYHSVVYQSKVDFSCDLPYLFFDYNCNQWQEAKYTDYGLAVQVRTGGS